MDKIIEFPKKSDIEWLTIEKKIRKQLKNINELSNEDINYICKRTKIFYNKILNKQIEFRNIKIPKEVPDKYAKEILKSVDEVIHKEIFKYMMEIFQERYELEVELVINDFIFEGEV